MECAFEVLSYAFHPSELFDYFSYYSLTLSCLEGDP